MATNGRAIFIALVSILLSSNVCSKEENAEDKRDFSLHIGGGSLKASIGGSAKVSTGGAGISTGGSLTGSLGATTDENDGVSGVNSGVATSSNETHEADSDVTTPSSIVDDSTTVDNIEGGLAENVTQKVIHSTLAPTIIPTETSESNNTLPPTKEAQSTRGPSDSTATFNTSPETRSSAVPFPESTYFPNISFTDANTIPSNVTASITTIHPEIHSTQATNTTNTGEPEINATDATYTSKPSHNNTIPINTAEPLHNVTIPYTTESSSTSKQPSVMTTQSPQIGSTRQPKCPIISRIVSKSEGICEIFNINNVNTFDGLQFFIPSSSLLGSSLTLVHESSTDLFSIQAKVVGEKAIEIYLYEDGVIKLSLKMRQGKFLKEQYISGYRITQKANHIIVNADVGYELVWDMGTYIGIEITEKSLSLVGLCGNNNMNPSDDQLLLQSLTTWISKVSFLYNCSYCALDNMDVLRPELEFCKNILTDERKLGMCKTIINSQIFLKACSEAYCKCGLKCACSTIEHFAKKCRRIGGSPNEVNVCPKPNCKEGTKWDHCNGGCSKTCQSPTMLCSTTSVLEKCLGGCTCPEGMVKDKYQGSCVKISNCMCEWISKNKPTIAYKPGQVVNDGCKTCKCINGKFECTEKDCEAECLASGDPHFRTFDGVMYDYMGECEYYLVKSKEFEITIKNQHCNKMRHLQPTCVRGVTVKFEGTVIKLLQGKVVLVDEKEIKIGLNHVTTKSKIVISTASSMFTRVSLPLSNKVIVEWDGVNRVHVTIGGGLKGKVAGLCGTYDDDKSNDFLTPEGDIESKITKFGDKWQVESKTICPEAPEPGKPCDNDNDKLKLVKEMCKSIISDEGPFASCHKLVDPHSYYKDCIYDVCSCGKDIERCLCPNVGDYATICTLKGIALTKNWRSHPMLKNKCHINCPIGMEYQECVNTCQFSCEDLSMTKICPAKCVEGCACPKGQLVGHDGKCMDIKNCPCKVNGKLLLPNQHIKKDDKECVCMAGICKPVIMPTPKPTTLPTPGICKINEEWVQCIESLCHQKCGQSEQICSKTEKCSLGCVCKKGFVRNDKNICVKPSECMCHHGGKSYSHGNSIELRCSKMTCNEGLWSVEKKHCTGLCSTYGESHFLTFDQKWYQFQGNCSYTLSRSKENAPHKYNIEITNQVCGTSGVVCKKAIKIQYELNGVTNTLVLADGHVKMLKSAAFGVNHVGLYIYITTPIGMTVLWNKGTLVYLKLPANFVNKVEGLCGNFNEIQTDEYLGPAGGKPFFKPTAFGDSWKTDKNCDNALEIKDTCHIPEKKHYAARQCSILSKPIFEECHALINPKPFLEKCIYDTCGCDFGGECECTCTAIQAYSEACNMVGVHVKWRSQALCPIQCGCSKPGSDFCPCYSACVSVCPPKTCKNKNDYAKELIQCRLNNEEICVEGCTKKPCPPGHVLEDNSPSAKCIPEIDCHICPEVIIPKCSQGEKIITSTDEHGCRHKNCSCHPETCPKPLLACAYDKIPVRSNPGACCPKYECKCPTQKDCKNEKKPALSSPEEDGLIAIKDPKYCCDKWLVKCGHPLRCEGNQICADFEIEKILVEGKCCNKTKCVCDTTKCPKKEKPKCSKVDEIHQLVDENACCKTYECKCPQPEQCPETKRPDDLEVGEVAILDKNYCCPHWEIKCSGECPKDPVCNPHESLDIISKSKCCQVKKCVCDKKKCPKNKIKPCPFDKVMVPIDETACCIKYECRCPPEKECIDEKKPENLSDGEVAVLNTNYCCKKWNTICGPTCPAPPKCKEEEQLNVVFEGKCCNKTACECYPKLCPTKPMPECLNGKRIVIEDPTACCKEYKCRCPPAELCPKVEAPDDLDEGEVAILNKDECCDSYIRFCKKDLCTSLPSCKSYEDLIKEKNGRCCEKGFCECNKAKCPIVPQPKCNKHDESLVVVDSSACCKEYECKCPPLSSCPNILKPTELQPGEVIIRDPDFCCPRWLKICKEETCPSPKSCKSHEILKVIGQGPCCNITSCECFPQHCPEIKMPDCPFDQIIEVVNPKACCKTYKCVCPPKTRCENETVECKNLGEHIVEDKNYCCPKKECKCIKESCPQPPTCQPFQRLEVIHEGNCCNITKCACFPENCPVIKIPDCPYDQEPVVVDDKACCKTYKCQCPQKSKCPNVTEPTDLEIGQQVTINKNFCCKKIDVVCVPEDKCPLPPVCKSYEILNVVHQGTCCNTTVCACLPENCPVVKQPQCICDRQRTVVEEKACCKEYTCSCPSNCTHEIKPTYEELDFGEIAVKNPSCCCDKWDKICMNKDFCPKPPICKSFEDIAVMPGKCCNKSICACVKEKCPPKPDIKCNGDKVPTINDPEACCPDFSCHCPSNCDGRNEEKPTNLQPGQIAVKDPSYCCDKWIIKCVDDNCPPEPVCNAHEQLQVIHQGVCCNLTSCKCFPPGCPEESKVLPTCEYDKKVKVLNPNECCKKYKCECPAPEKTVNDIKPKDLEIGQCAVLDERFCGKRWKIECCGECPPPKKCPIGHKEEIVFEGKCCNQTTCACDPDHCPKESKIPPVCGPDMKVVAEDPNACCKKWRCDCIPKDKCPISNKIENLDVGQVQVQCPDYKCCEKKCTICSGTCPAPPTCLEHESLRTIRNGPCCNESACECYPTKCPNKKIPTCKKDTVVQIIDEDACCKSYHCVCPDPKNCENELVPEDLQEGEIIVKDESFCCTKWKRECNKTMCSQPPECKSHEKPVVVHKGKCCEKFECQCYPHLCPNVTVPECPFDKIAIISNPLDCCKTYECVCPSKCKTVEKPHLEAGELAIRDMNFCCPPWNVTCDTKCPPDPECKENEQLEIVKVGKCCNETSCRCFPALCPAIPIPKCQFDQVISVVDEKACCKKFQCICPPKETCVDEKESNDSLEIGQCLLQNENFCCKKFEKKCCKEKCPIPPKCTHKWENPQIVRNGTCCPEYSCECFPKLCPPVEPPTCEYDEELIIINQNDCCKDYECSCPKNCSGKEERKPENLRPGQRAVLDKNYCCNKYKIECKKTSSGENDCPRLPVCDEPGMVPEVYDSGPCCNLSKCSCNPKTCPVNPMPECYFDKKIVRTNALDECCPQYSCKCPINCTNESQPSVELLEIGQVWVKDERYCCDKWVKQCAGSCPADPVCDEHEQLEIVQQGSCCNKTSCRCYPSLCHQEELPECSQYEKLVVLNPAACCKSYGCECIPKMQCPNISNPIDLEKGETFSIDNSGCCDSLHRKCSGNCPPEKNCDKGHKPVVTHEGKCCNDTSCKCYPELCPSESKQPPVCPYDQVPEVVDEDACCKEYRCVCPPTETCKNESKPELEVGQEAVRDNRYCCTRWKKICTNCPPEPVCGIAQNPVIIRNGTCCPEYKCGCFVSECPKISMPTCLHVDEKLKAIDENSCCKEYECKCPASDECPIVKPIKPVFPGEVAIQDPKYCCKRDALVCDKRLCPKFNNTCGKNQVIKQIPIGILHCCNLHMCVCNETCPNVNVTCSHLDEKIVQKPDDPYNCCKKNVCECPNCEKINEKKPEKLEPGMVAVKDERYCCNKWIKKCHKDQCPKDPTCESWQQLETVFDGECCEVKKCTCLPSKCPKVDIPSCRENEVQKMIDPNACCKSFRCECIPSENCTKTESPDDLDIGEVAVLDEKGCCPKWYKVCGPTCPNIPKCGDYEIATIVRNGTCCPHYECGCFKDSCPKVKIPSCSIIGQIPEIIDQTACCHQYECRCPDKPCEKLEPVDNLEEGQISVVVKKGRCCPITNIVCSGICPKEPICEEDQVLKVTMAGSCCNKTACQCDKCPTTVIPVCKKVDMIVKVVNSKACCKKFECVCPPKENCTKEEKPTDLQDGELAVLDKNYCCPKYKVSCSGKCPADPVCDEPGMTLQTITKGRCCETKKCTCLKSLCEINPEIKCQFDKQLVDLNPGDCCVKKTCNCPSNCTDLDEDKPSFLEEGQVAVLDERFCCKRWKVFCKGQCKAEPTCKPHESLSVIREGKCCNESICKCTPSKCSKPTLPECREDQRMIVVDPAACCKTYKCICKISKEDCATTKLPNDLRPGQVAKIDKSSCCNRVKILCDEKQCPHKPICKHYEKLEVIKDVCCNISTCVCDKCKIPPQPKCKLPDMIIKSKQVNKCCQGLICSCPEKCNKQCEKPGYKYFEPNLDDNGKKLSCCGECKPVVCFEDSKSLKIAPKIHKPGEKWQRADDPCTVYECIISESEQAKTITMITDCNTKCKLGEEYIVPKGQCCGSCIKNKCVFENNITLEVDDSFIHDKCCNFTCTLDEEAGLPMERESCIHCKDEECEIGFEYFPPQANDCCGRCVQTQCIVHGQTLDVGESMQSPNDTCFNLLCEKSETEDRKFAYTVKKIPKYGLCPTTPCTKNCLIPDPSKEGCCMTCEKHCYKPETNCSVKNMFDIPEQSKQFIKIIKDGKLCENKQILPNLKECAGLCPSLTYVNVDKTQDTKQMGSCSCCIPSSFQKRKIHLTCLDQTKTTYIYNEPKTCICNMSNCELMKVKDQNTTETHPQSDNSVLEAMKRVLKKLKN